jgi:hypothetical protein
LLILSVAFSHATLAATLLVPEDLSLDEALTSSVPGDTVSVAGGTLECGAVTLPPGIVLLSRESQGNSLAQLLAWNLTLPSEVRGFHFTSYFLCSSQPSNWRGVIVDNSEVSFVDCQFILLDSWIGTLDSSDYPGASDSYRYPLKIDNGSTVSLNSCKISMNILNIWFPGAPGAISSSGSSLEILNCLFEQQPFAIESHGPLTITDSTFRDCHWYYLHSTGSLWMLGNLIVNSGPYYWVDRVYSTKEPYPYCRETRSIDLSGAVHLYRNTFVDNPVYLTSDYQCDLPEPDLRLPLVTIDSVAQGWIQRNLFIGLSGPAVEAPASIEVSCNDAWDGLAQYWTGGIGDVTGTNGNISEAPIFCDRRNGDYTLSVQSPAANADCGLMGTFSTNCDTKLEIPADGGDVPKGQPASLRTRLLGAAPNPFNPRTEIRFELEHSGDVQLEIFDVAGRLVRGWGFPQLEAGPHSIPWDAHDAHGNAVASGVYHLRLLTGGKVMTSRAALLR